MEDEALKNREITHFESWLLIFSEIDLGLTVHQQKRIFFCMQQVENGPGCKIDSADFANFILSVGPRFDAQEWKNILKAVRERVLSQ